MRIADFITATLVLGATIAQAQTVASQSGTLVPVPPYRSCGGYPTGYNVSSTIGEGYARGLADVIRSQGDYNLSTSAAAINLSLARQQEIQNGKTWVKTYFDIRDINRTIFEAEQKHRRGNAADWARYAQVGKPKRLAASELDAVTGRIYWPVLLTAQNYKSQRVELEKVFAERAYQGVIGAETYLKTVQLTDELLADLQSRVRDLPADKYLAARRFLESLAFEAGQPTG
jgi:hypothetical protein